MADRHDLESPDALVLMHVLEKMRARNGLSAARLQSSRSDEAAPLLRLAATHRYATVHNVGLHDAALAIVAECIQETVDGTHRIVADAVLGLGVLSDVFSRSGLDDKTVQALRADSLGTRRTALLANWRRLHEAIGEAPSEPPSDRTLRGTTEREVLQELARQLVMREDHSIGARNVVLPGQTPSSEPRTRGHVVVVGGAVMDATFRTSTYPQLGTSTEARSFDLSPGGKGLTQAVAAARLGLDVSLVAAVADDRFGREIIDYLHESGVDTSLLKVVRDARTPFTGVLEMELGDSVAVNWRNQMEVRLDVRDIERLAGQLAGCDAVLLTFEVPRETLQRALALVHADHDQRPMVIVTPGQPYANETISNIALAQIDYLVAHPWELGPYSPPEQPLFDPDPVARHLLTYGVETLFILNNGGCTIYSATELKSFTVPSFSSIYRETSAARDAFCAALAARLIEDDGTFSEPVALWATAAMSCAIADFPLSNSMPDRQRIEQLLTRSRFTVQPPP
jgi:ribokinase